MSIFAGLKFVTSHPLNKGHKVGSVLRYLKWQVGSRLVPGPVVFDWIQGARFLVRSGENGLTGNIYTGLQEFSDMAFLLHVLRADDLFIDVGANLGSYTILACSAVGATAYAFEPVPETFSRLNENIRLNHLDDSVKCLNIGLGGEAGSIDFTADMDACNHVVSVDEVCENRVTVEVQPLDEVMKDESPMLMKIDVEGYETCVLDGAAKTLRNRSLKAVIMELNGSGDRYGFDEGRLVRLMHDYGFSSFSYDPMERRLVDLHGEKIDDGNTLFIRDESFVLERIRTSPKVRIGKKLI